jgi:hypothetical protein
MTLDVWKVARGHEHITAIKEIAWRMVEAQHMTATRKLVDSLEEQIILEELIEETKPSLSSSLQSLHPLLSTPFRYPPLAHGSRFGSNIEHALWYGALSLKTVMAEKAFYQYHFLHDSIADYGVVEVPLTAFSSTIKSAKAIRLTHAPFVKYKTQISSPISYAVSQPLGSAMREEGIEAFTYHSARDQIGINVALFTPKAFARKQPNEKSFQSWQCVVDHDVIEFVRSNALLQESQIFYKKDFIINGKLPPLMG